MTLPEQPKAKTKWWKVVLTIIITLLITGLVRACYMGCTHADDYKNNLPQYRITVTP
jgi:hypothetical protein